MAELFAGPRPASSAGHPEGRMPGGRVTGVCFSLATLLLHKQEKVARPPAGGRNPETIAKTSRNASQHSGVECGTLRMDQVLVRIGAAIAVELPDIAHLADLVE